MPEYLTLATPLWPTKDVNSKNDYGADWSDLAPASDSIVSTTWPTGGPLTFTNIRDEGLVSYADISGGVEGQIYEVDITVQTAQGRTLNRTMRLIVVQKKE